MIYTHPKCISLAYASHKKVDSMKKCAKLIFSWCTHSLTKNLGKACEKLKFFFFLWGLCFYKKKLAACAFGTLREMERLKN